MRRYVAPVLCAAALVAGCASAPPPPPPAPVAPPAPVPAPVVTVAVPTPAPAPPPPPPPRRKHVKVVTFEFVPSGAIKLPGPVVFETGSDKLDPVSDEVLEVVHDYLDAKPEITLLRVEGHTDSDGNPAANQTLSEKRALAVAHWLVGVGVACNRLLPVGFGQTKPIVPNDTPANKALNRRVDFVNAAVKGRALGGKPVDGGGKVAGDPCH